MPMFEWPLQWIGSWFVFSDLTFEISGKGVSVLKKEAGGHRAQRVPPTERKGRVHTSSVTVAVLDPSEVSAASLNKHDIEIQWFSGQGAGGQHRNKTQNCCRVIHKPSGLQEARQGRSREANKREAMSALELRLNAAGVADSATKTDANRRSQIGTGIRGDKIRTYRAQDGIVIDHHSGKRGKFSKVMKGGFSVFWE